MIVGSATADDAGVFRLSKSQALVQTVDFFTPIVDDPFTYGEIAATNSLSDVYAMGGRPLTAMNVMGMPDETVPPEVINQILRGGAKKAKEANCVLVGGHTIRNPEPIYGLSVTGLVHPRRIITNAGARPGDYLVLTKRLGTGIITTGIKRGIASGAGAKAAIRSMTLLNTAGADLAEAGLVMGGTDVTGFGLLGHLASMCRSSKVGAELYAKRIPLLTREVVELVAKGCVPGGTRQNLETVEPLMQWDGISPEMRLILADAQTSGGLLLCIAPRKLPQAMGMLRRAGTPTQAVIGRIVRSRRPGIRVMQDAPDEADE